MKLQKRLIQTPPDIRSIIDVDEFDEKYPPLPGEMERDTTKKPTIN